MKSQEQIYGFSLTNLNRKNKQTLDIITYYGIIRWHLDVNLPDSNILKSKQGTLRRIEIMDVELEECSKNEFLFFFRLQ